MYLAETGQSAEEALVAQKAKMLGVNPTLALKKYREIQRAMAQAPSKVEYLKAALESAKKEHKEALEMLAELREKARSIKDIAKRAEAQEMIEQEGQRLRRAGTLLAQGEGGLGLIWFAPVMGLVIAGATTWLFFENKDKIGDMIGKSADAIVVMAYTTAIGVGIFGLLYFARIARDIWEPKDSRREARYVPQRG